jgi:cysteine-rich repeat protein
MKKNILILIFSIIPLMISCAGDGSKCGDGIEQEGEECDDGNIMSGDGCAYNCKVEVFCGNGVCESGEIHTCPTDCDICGNSICDVTESVSTCFPDCFCGNGSCDHGEDTSICPNDCQSVPNCGNAICELGETTNTCLQDCYCLNDTCDDGETQATCPQDCTGAVCGDNACEHGESADNCPQDCSSTNCGDSICEGTENETSCPQDCSAPEDCGNGTLDSGEQCDGSNLNNTTCSSLGYDTGTLSCSSTCFYNESNCSNNSGTCDIYTQTGCGTGEKCTIDTSIVNRCNTAGSGLDGDVCNADDECAGYLTCSGLQYNSFGICRRICYDKISSYDQIHCTGGDGSICNYDVVGGDNIVVPDAHLCTTPCDPVNATGCPSGLRCDLFDNTREGFHTFFTECYELNNTANNCGSSPCSAGYTCIDGTTCIKLCYSIGDCPDGLNCYDFSGLAGFRIFIGSTEYGYCNY